MYSCTYEDLKVCRVCLSADTKLVHLNSNGFAQTLSELCGISVSQTDGLPQYLCVFCCQRLRRAAEFRNKCRTTHKLLSECLIEVPCLTTSFLKTLEIGNTSSFSTTKVNIESYPEIPIERCLVIDIKPEFNLDNDIEYYDESYSPYVDCSKDENERILNNDIEYYNESCSPYVECNKDENESNLAKNNVVLKSLSTSINDLLRNTSKSDKKSENLKNDTPKELCVIKPEGEVTQKKNKEQIKLKQLVSKEDRSKEFSLKYLDNVSTGKKEFYGYILEKYIINESKCSNDDILFTKEDSSELIYNQTKHENTEEILSDPNLSKNRRKLYKYLTEKYKTNNLQDIKLQQVTDISRMREKTIETSRKKSDKNSKTYVRTREGLTDFSRTYNFEVFLLDREQQIQDLMSRKETDKYQRALFKCELCFAGFAEEKSFQNHMAIHDSTSRPYECQICHVRFQKKILLTKHVQLRHKYKFICKLCKQVSRSTTQAREHYKSHEGCQYSCEHCGKIFRKYGSRMNHIRIHHGAVICEICQERFVGETGLLAHTIKAHREIFKCVTCGVQFHNPDAIKKHSQSLTDVCGCGTNIRPCTQCGDNFNSEDLLKQHMLEYHNRRNPYKTNKRTIKLPKEKPNVKWRAKRKARAKYDEMERETETMERIGKKEGQRTLRMCEMCGQEGFSSEAKLRYHQRIHTGEKPHPCPHCDKRFRIKELLEKHIKTHTGDRPFECAHCSKAFKTASAHYRHQVVHTKIRRHRCHLCEKMFRTSTCVKTHIKAVHMKLPAYCPLRERRRNTGTEGGEEYNNIPDLNY